jgi:lipopolysaccharide/colanic/teichoic acid biosynthesis glycosyltransferase
MQRFLDILVAATALIVLSPLLVPIVVILRFTGEGEIFYAQPRVGRHGHMIRIYKFATMLKNSPSLGTGTVTVKDDPRVLPFGRFLRKTKLNELPQLINVLSGDMSLIGPRPQTPRCFNAFPLEYHTAITSVRPGLSGIGSIVFRNEQEMMDGSDDSDRLYDQVIMPYKAQLESWFVANQGIVTYLKLIALTLWVVAFPRSRATSRLFPTLPAPSEEIARLLAL